MAALAAPLIEGATMALLRALGVVAATGVGAAAINDIARKKTEAADKAKAAPIAQAATRSKTRDACSKCPPDCGSLVTREWNMSDDSRSYQARITGFAPYSEWLFSGTDFDGFKSGACMLIEAKARYDQFFDSSGTPKIFFEIAGISKIRAQATRQSMIVSAAKPASLHWHFMQPLSYRYFSRFFKGAAPLITSHLTP